MQFLMLTDNDDHGAPILVNVDEISGVYVEESLLVVDGEAARWTDIMTNGETFRVTETPNQIAAALASMGHLVVDVANHAPFGVPVAQEPTEGVPDAPPIPSKGKPRARWSK